MNQVDIVIVGAGLSGLTLARQIAMRGDHRVLLLDKQLAPPGDRQKVGESTVQVGGYYFSKVLGLEAHLFRAHLMKYNLRFYWNSRDRSNEVLDDCGQSYIRELSNIPCFQLDRNVFELELLRLATEHERCEVATGVRELEIALGKAHDHTVSFLAADGTARKVQSRWVVDATGYGRVLARQRDLRRTSPIRHGTSFFWVDGLVDIDALGRRGPDDARLSPARGTLGHLPLWLATNHFMGRGFWFWVIPLQGKTSLGLVYDTALIDTAAVRKPADLIAWVCERFPLFADDLPHRRVLDHGCMRNYSHECGTTIDPAGWAMTGVAGRFSDPLYSPGSDIIALHNTFITALLDVTDPEELRGRCAIYETTLAAMNDALTPSYHKGYDALGDQESFALKYSWELTIYFGFYVFPFITDQLLDPKFLAGFLRRFARLGPLNLGVQELLSAFHRWQAERGDDVAPRVFHEFKRLSHLNHAADLFYRVDVSRPEALNVLEDLVERLEELARFLQVWVAARVLGRPELVRDVAFVSAFTLDRIVFDEEAFRAAAALPGVGEDAGYPWKMDPDTFVAFARSAK